MYRFRIDVINVDIFNCMGIIINSSTTIYYELVIIVAMHCGPLIRVFRPECPSRDFTAERSRR